MRSPFRHFFLFLAFLLLFSSCSKPPSILQQVKESGKLVVLTRNSATTYYQGKDGPTGLEYDLAKRFADELGVKLEIIVENNLSKLLEDLEEQDAHLAAAGLTITEERMKKFRFAPAYQEINANVIYRRGTPKPKSIEDLYGMQIEVIGNSSHAERLKEIKKNYPELHWDENENIESDELLYLVWREVLDYTVADSNEFSLNQPLYPELKKAFAIHRGDELAWAFPKTEDDSLFNAARDFFINLEDTGELTQLIEKHYGHVQEFDYVGTRRFLRHINERLPLYEDYFKKAADKFGLDWHLLAAIGYQESHWNPKAVSPTGVRGIMMLTRATASSLGIKNRIDAQKSIMGGAEYFTSIRNRIPDRIEEPDRSWLALAAYNVGMGHLEDARRLTEQAGFNPDTWLDVKEHLPLLSVKKWYTKTRYGYARGREPVRYVDNIRVYHDILVQLDLVNNPVPTPPKLPKIETPAL